MTVSEARAELPRILDRVGAGEEVILTRHGEPVAVVIRPDALRSRRADEALDTAERLRGALELSKSRRLPAPALSEDRAKALVAEIRRGRSRR